MICVVIRGTLYKCTVYLQKEFRISDLLFTDFFFISLHMKHQADNLMNILSTEVIIVQSWPRWKTGGIKCPTGGEYQGMISCGLLWIYIICFSLIKLAPSQYHLLPLFWSVVCMFTSISSRTTRNTMYQDMHYLLQHHARLKKLWSKFHGSYI